jgi:surface protein
MTNHHVLDKEYIETKDIIISLNNEEDYLNIDMDPSIGRRFYTDEQFDSTFIEIKENEIDKNRIHFLEVDQRIDNYRTTGYDLQSLKNEPIYILNYPENSNIVNSRGVLKQVKDNEKIIHDCQTRYGSSGSPILSLNTFQVLGIHSQGKKGENKEVNRGYFIHKPIFEFLEYIKETPIPNNNKKNENKEKEKIVVKDTPKDEQEKKENKEIDSLNIMTIIYRVRPNDSYIKIFGKQFVENNRYKCKIIVEDNEQDICEKLPVNDNIKRKNTLEILLIETSTINDMSYLFGGDYFDGCEALLSVPDIHKWDTKNVTNMSHLFNNCTSLQSLPDISEWNTSKVTDMNTMFSNCQSLLYLPDISKWDTSNVTNMAYMFQSCGKLSNLPDIGRWNTDKVTYMKDMFTGSNPALNVPVKFKNQECKIF